MDDAPDVVAWAMQPRCSEGRQAVAEPPNTSRCMHGSIDHSIDQQIDAHRLQAVPFHLEMDRNWSLIWQSLHPIRGLHQTSV